MDEKGKTALWEEYSQTKDPKIREKLILLLTNLNLQRVLNLRHMRVLG